MPLYEYACHTCEKIVDVFHKMDDDSAFTCDECGGVMERLISAVFTKRPDADWIRGMNGIVNDLEMVNQGKEERIETREQMVRRVEEMYAEPYPEAEFEWQKAANKRVGELRTRYKERFK